MKDFNKINKWIKKKNYELKSGKDDCIYFSERVIQINFTKNELHIIYSLLHECGHLITFNKASYSREFSNLAMSRHNKRVCRTNRFKYELLKDEMIAWESGLALAKKLKIKINADDYYAYASKWFMTYVRFVN